MRVTAPIAILSALLLLAGCAGASPVDPGQEQPDGVAAPTRPFPSVEVDCASLIDQAVIDEAFNPATLPIPLSFDGSGGYYAVSQLGLEQAGALRCEWSDGGAVSGSESYLQVSVLNEATDAWAEFSDDVALYQTTANTFGDASFQDCKTSGGQVYCRVDVLADSRWLSAIVGGVADEAAAASVIDAALNSLETAADAEEPWESPTVAPTDCESLAPLGVLTDVVGEMEPWDREDVPTQPVLYHAGFLAAGGMLCSWRNSFSSASALTTNIAVLPGGGWAWDDYWAGEASDRVTRETVDGLGDAAYTSCEEDGPCYASVLVGDTWLDVTVNDEASTDSRAAAVELAKRVIPSLQG